MPKEKIFQGPISINTKGVGFFDIDPSQKKEVPSIEIQPQFINKAFHGDTVEITLSGEKIKGREQGKVLKIIKRAKDEFVGVVEKHDGKTYVIPDDKRLYVDIFLSGKSNANEGDKVLVKIVDWDNLHGEVIKVIGKKGENNTEMESIVLEKGFRIEFPDEVEAEAEKIRVSYKATATIELTHRRDLRNVI